jgi:hypothetical protein
VAEVKEDKNRKFVNKNRNVCVHCYIAGEPGQPESALPHGQDWWNTVSRHSLVFAGRKRGTASLFSPSDNKRVFSTGKVTVMPSTVTLTVTLITGILTVAPNNGKQTHTLINGVTTTTLTSLQKTTVKFKLSTVFPRNKRSNVTHADITSTRRLLAETQEKKNKRGSM